MQDELNTTWKEVQKAQKRKLNMVLKYHGYDDKLNTSKE